MDKVGFLYTVGILILGLTILSLAFFIADINQSSNEKVADLARFERLHNLDSSINRAFAEIFQVSSGISFAHSNLTNNTLFITETLPNNNNTIFSQNMSSFELYLNTSISTPSENFTVNRNNIENIKNVLPLIILPYNLAYTHNPTFGSSIIKVTPKDGFNFLGYNVTIISSTAIHPSLDAYTAPPGNDMIYRIQIKDQTATTRIEKFWTSSTSGPTTMTVKDSTGVTNLLTISLDDAKLTVNNLQSGTNKLTVTIGIILRGDQTELTKIVYPGKIYNVTLQNLNVKTVSGVTLLTLQV